ncbi:hypothetical protein ACOSQ4_031456 [Xanthoceras sorbifolium]
MAWRNGYIQVILESDSADTINILLKETNINHPFSNLIFKCKELIKGCWNCAVKHIFWEGNLVADCLAGIGKHRALGTVFYILPPVEVSNMLELDAGSPMDSC